MRDKKRRLEFYSYYDYTGISEHLEKMAKKGWMIESMSNFGWVYRRIEPQNLKFSVSYFSKASEFDPEPSDKQKEFIDYCEHTGWKFACSSAQLQVFYNEDENATPIETDFELEIEVLHRSFKRGVLPSYVILLGTFIMYLMLNVRSAQDNLISFCSEYSYIFSSFTSIFGGVYVLMDIVRYYAWRSKVKKIYNCTSVKSSNTVSFNKIMTYISFIMLGLYLISLTSNIIFIVVFALFSALFVSVIVVGVSIKKLLKKKKIRKQINFSVTMVVVIILSFAIIPITIIAMIFLLNSGYFDDKNVTKYKYNNRTFTAYNHELPLNIEDFTDVEYDKFSKELEANKTFILEHYTARQEPRVGDDSEGLHILDYEIVNVKWGFLYNSCKDAIIKNKVKYDVFQYEYKKDNADVWGANEVYRLYDKYEGYENDYIVCYDNIILQIDFTGELTDDNKKTISKVLNDKF